MNDLVADTRPRTDLRTLSLHKAILLRKELRMWIVKVGTWTYVTLLQHFGSLKCNDSFYSVLIELKILTNDRTVNLCYIFRLSCIVQKIWDNKKIYL
jgi:hypothetical protein